MTHIAVIRLRRVQNCPSISAEMHRILRTVQSECGPWVGLSVVHLGDRDVPNALVFIDKYTQVMITSKAWIHAAVCEIG